MKPFSLKRLKERLEGPAGFAFSLTDSQEEAREVGGLGSSGHAFVNEAVACVLVGHFGPAEQLFSKARDWIREAISSGEIPNPYFPHGTEAIWFSDLAAAEWYLSGNEDHSLLQQSVDHHVEYLDSGVGRDSIAVELVAVDFLLASRCEDLLSLVDEVAWRKEPRSPSTELKAAVRWCGPDRQDSVSILRTLLKVNTHTWLEKGHYLRPVKWSRLLARPGTSPTTTVEEVLTYIRPRQMPPA